MYLIFSIIFAIILIILALITIKLYKKYKILLKRVDRVDYLSFLLMIKYSQECILCSKRLPSNKDLVCDDCQKLVEKMLNQR